MKKYVVFIFVVFFLFTSTQSNAEVSEITKRYMKMALENPQELRIPNNFREVILYIKDPSVAKIAIKKGAYVNGIRTMDDENKTILHYLAHNYNAVDVLDLIVKYQDNIDSKDDKGITPLMEAIKAGQSVDFIQHLLDAGANVNLVSQNETAISIAAEEGRDEIIAVLLENGAKPGPKALKKLKHIDELDQKIKEFWPDFNYLGVTHKMKHYYLEYFEKNRPILLKQVAQTIPTTPVLIHGKPINDYIAEAPIYHANYTVDDFNESTVWKKYPSYAAIIAKNKVLKLTTQYRGEVEKKTGTRQTYDSNCKRALAESYQTHRNLVDMNRCIAQGIEASPQYASPLLRGELVEICSRVSIQEAFEYDVRNNNIKRNCRIVSENYPYTEFKKGVALYLYKDKPIAALSVENSSTEKIVNGVPSSKILLEMQMKYGPYYFEVDEANNEHYFFNNIGEWKPVLTLKYKDASFFSKTTPEKYQIWFVHGSVENIINDALDETKIKDAVSIQKEEKEYWEQLKKEREEKINSFTL